MFNLKTKISRDAALEILKTNKEALQEFEKNYQQFVLESDKKQDNLFRINAKKAVKDNNLVSAESITKETINKLKKVKSDIHEELMSQTGVWSYRAGQIDISDALPNKGILVRPEDIKSLPESLRPQLTGYYMQADIGVPSGFTALEMYKKWQDTGNVQAYHIFRQGLDILDVDQIIYNIIGTNQNSMGYWLPRIAEAVKLQDFFKIPNTKIIKVPLPMLQLTRLEYESLTQTTKEIVDEFCEDIFELDRTKSYFIKTGTFSSKYDFRNAKVTGANEVKELGEYLLFIHYQACMMASPLNNVSVYGVSTTNEWVVREFIEDKENNPCIYKGLPLHTEYRVFVDFDSRKVIGVNPYWDPKVMKKHFEEAAENGDTDAMHDYMIYSIHQETLTKRYEENFDKVISHMNKLLQDVTGLSGQWSVDVMQNGEDFWLIDMAWAQNSALRECIPKNEIRKMKENWIPQKNII